MAGWVKVSFHVNPAKLRACLQTGKYEAYALSVGQRMRLAAVQVFERQQKHSNEWRVSNRTPPKYVSSFRLSFHRASLVTRLANEDPGWATVEFGFHPGDDPDTYVPAMRPLRRALLMVARGV